MSNFALVLSDWNLIFDLPNPNEEQVVEGLAKKVQELLMNDRKFLFQALYRLDVDEEKVNWVMQREQKDRQAMRLAELIFKREIQKAKSRRASEAE